MFEIGDRVKITACDDNSNVIGMVGKVADDDYKNYDFLGIAFSENINGNNLNENTEDGYGWYIDTWNLELVEKHKEEE